MPLLKGFTIFQKISLDLKKLDLKNLVRSQKNVMDLKKIIGSQNIILDLKKSCEISKNLVTSQKIL